MNYPISPTEELDGLVYFPRMCDKIRLHRSEQLDPTYHPNLGLGMDLWTCQFLQVKYEDLTAQVASGKTDTEVLQWAYNNGKKPSPEEKNWWNSYMRNRGFRDDLSQRLIARVAEGGYQGFPIFSFFDYIDVDEGRVNG
jgi:hypothetical protein